MKEKRKTKDLTEEEFLELFYWGGMLAGPSFWNPPVITSWEDREGSVYFKLYQTRKNDEAQSHYVKHGHIKVHGRHLYISYEDSHFANIGRFYELNQNQISYLIERGFDVDMTYIRPEFTDYEALSKKLDP